MDLHVLKFRRFHVSYLLGWWAVGICGGLLLAKYTGLSVGGWYLLVALALFLGAVRSRKFAAVLLVMVSGLLIGGERGSNFLVAIAPYQNLVGQEVAVEGRIAADPSLTKRGEQRVDVGNLAVNGQELPGEIYTTTDAEGLKRGDKVELQGKLSEGFGSFQASMYRAEVSSVIRPDDIVRDIRENFANSVRSVVREPEASLGLGFVVGQRSSLPPDLDEQLRMVGLTHIVVASGYNLTILVRFARRLFVRISRYMATVSSLFLMGSFALFSGFSPSMNRAVAVTGLSLLAWHYGRKFHPLLLIAYVSALTAYLNPVYIWADIGWYLSFLAFAGILVIAPMISRVFRKWDASPLAQVLLETTAAQIMTLPIILLTFGELPNLALIANLLVAPVIPFAMAVTTLAGVVAMAAQPLAGIFGWLTYISIGYVVAIVDWLASVPAAQDELHLPLGAAMGVYALIVTVVVMVRWRAGFDFRGKSIVE